MLTVNRTIKQNKLFVKGDIVGVAVSGGMDSMSLLHFLNSKKEKYGIEVVAINIDHQMRKESAQDSEFVASYCKKQNIKFNKFNVDVISLVNEKKYTKEEGAREARYAIFDALIRKGVVTKIALGHHISDQAETVLLNLFRGTGLTGAKGMNLVRNNYVRPMLYTKKLEIENYNNQEGIGYVTDISNLENEYSRNFLRNEIMPLIKTRWKGVETNIVNFSKTAKIDDNYISSKVNTAGILKQEALVKIPISYFLYEESIVNRMLRYCFKYLQLEKDIERKHLKIIKGMVKDAGNGIKINLPNKIIVHKEYDYITIISKTKKYKFNEKPLKSGVIEIKSFGKITVKRTYKIDVNKKDHIVDVKKVPKGSLWRPRQDGDIFTKFGGGTKKLKDYLINKKIPKRLREGIPVLAKGKEVFIVAGYDISEKIKVDENTKSAYVIKYDIKSV